MGADMEEASIWNNVERITRVRLAIHRRLRQRDCFHFIAAEGTAADRVIVRGIAHREPEYAMLKVRDRVAVKGTGTNPTPY